MPLLEVSIHNNTVADSCNSIKGTSEVIGVHIVTKLGENLLILCISVTDKSSETTWAEDSDTLLPTTDSSIDYIILLLLNENDWCKVRILCKSPHNNILCRNESLRERSIINYIDVPYPLDNLSVLQELLLELVFLNLPNEWNVDAPRIFERILLCKHLGENFAVRGRPNLRSCFHKVATRHICFVEVILDTFSLGI